MVGEWLLCSGGKVFKRVVRTCRMVVVVECYLWFCGGCGSEAIVVPLTFAWD